MNFKRLFALCVVCFFALILLPSFVVFIANEDVNEFQRELIFRTKDVILPSYSHSPSTLPLMVLAVSEVLPFTKTKGNGLFHLLFLALKSVIRNKNKF